DACMAEGPRNVPLEQRPSVPEGAVVVVDVARAKSDPANSVLAKVPAGCSAVRLAISPDGGRAYVTARNSNALVVFDAAKLVSDPEHARIATVPVGTSPVGVAVVDGGGKIIVTNSNRFSNSPTDNQYLTVIDAANVASGAAAVLGTIPAGGFPRELHATSDGRTLLLTNFTTGTLQVIDIARLPLQPKPAQ
ncbi:MAG: YncE family protein, partial [Bryobacteraceae bacterium]